VKAAALLLSLLFCAGPRAEALSAAATRVDITPDLERHRIYLAGYGAGGRRPWGVRDKLHARILLLSDGRKTVGIVGLDLLGYYRNDTQDLRRMAGFSGPDRYLFVAATHQHAGPDTLGLWGPLPGFSGVNARYHQEVKEKIAEALRDLESRLEPVELSGAVRAINPAWICRDLRDPAVIDPDLGVLRFRGKDGKVVATLVNYSCHPEVMGKDNRFIAADFPGPLCDEVERLGGGACLYLSGSIGGLLSPHAREGQDDFLEARRIGAALAAEAFKSAERPTVAAAKAALDFKSEIVLIPVENSRYLSFLPALTFGHRLKDAQGKNLPAWKAYWLPLKHVLRRLTPRERPWVETEVSRVDIGPAGLLGIPGEIFPELVIGGYDGKFRFAWPLLDAENPDPPDLARAPQGPYLKALIPKPLKLVVGLANDELGYLVPGYDFKIRDSLTLLPRLPGDHYEETNSIGPSATELITSAARRLLGGLAHQR
jgi:hypothetical protein